MNIIEMVDRLGDLDAQLKAVDGLLTERDALRRQLAEHADSLSDNEEILRGKRFSVIFAKPPTTRAINDVGAYLETVGVQGFIQSVKVSVSEATKLLSKAGQSRLFVEGRGSRRLKAVVANSNDSEIAAANFFNSLSAALAGDSLTPANRTGSNH